MEEILNDLIIQVNDLSKRVTNLEQYLSKKNEEVQEIINYAKKLRYPPPEYKKFPDDDYQI